MNLGHSADAKFPPREFHCLPVQTDRLEHTEALAMSQKWKVKSWLDKAVLALLVSLAAGDHFCNTSTP